VEHFLSSLATVFLPANFGLLFLGSVLGLVVGVLPGLSSPMALAVLIPVTYGMSPLSAFMILIGIYVGTKTGGAFSAILIRTPGTPAAAATAMEGYPMAQRGEAGRALGLSIGGSFVGGTLSWLVAVPLVGVIGQYAVQISAADLALIGILALAMVAGLSGHDQLKGLMAAALGLLLSTVGLDELTGTPRLTFGQYQLLGGLPFLPAIIGLFAIATVLIDVSQGIDGAQKPTSDKSFSLRRMVRDIWVMRKSVGAGSVIGGVLGVIPGVGSDTAGWLSLIYVRRRASHRRLSTERQQDEGIPEGVAAPESANNAVTGGATIPMLTLGIPGDGSTAVMLGALMLFGLQPGPMFFTNTPDVAYGVLVALGVANLTTLIAAILLIRPFVMVLRIDRTVILGIVAVLAMTGSFASTNSTFEIATAIGFGILGFLMHRYRFSIPALALGLILGPVIEANFRRALMITQGDWSVFLTSPLSLFSIVLMAGLAAHAVYRFGTRRNKAASVPNGSQHGEPKTRTEETT